MHVLKNILEDFSLATELTIKFHKSTFVPMNVDDETASAMANVLGCALSAFPQTYLGLPLSPPKLKPTDFQLLVTSFDKYLASWKARLMSSWGGSFSSMMSSGAYQSTTCPPIHLAPERSARAARCQTTRFPLDR